MLTASAFGFTLLWDHGEAVYNTDGELVYAYYKRRGRLIFVSRKHVNSIAYFQRQGEIQMREGSPLRRRTIDAMNARRRSPGIPELDMEP